ncbi:hypothetical protein ACROYT_G040502 [Oculina patagonica]
MLPASELYHMADLVCVVSPCNDDGSNMSGVSVMAVSPEGVVRYWPSLTHGSSSIDLDTDLIGSQCHSLTAFQPFGCILMTTTNELLLLSGSQKAIKCHNLNAPSSVFTELGRRMTSFIFGSQPAANHEATNWQRVLASNIMTDNSSFLLAPVKAADKTPVIAAHAARGTLTGKPTTVTAVPRLEAERTLDKPPIEIAE